VTISSVTRAWSRSSGQGTSDDGNKLTLSFTEGYQVVHTVDTTDLELLTAADLPATGSLFPGTFAACKTIGPITRIGPIYSIVAVSYEGEVGPNVNDSPLNQPPIYKWTDTTSNEAIDQDWDGNPICTVLGETIEGVTMDLADQSLNITRNYALFSPWITHNYRHATNSDLFANYAPGTARLIAFSADSVSNEGFPYWVVNATIQFRFPYNTSPEKAWYARTRHEGYYVKVGGKVVRATDDNKEPTTKPVLLKADGTRELNPANAIWLEWKRYNSLPYAALGLLD
jgi:hypothetical protein